MKSLLYPTPLHAIQVDVRLMAMADASLELLTHSHAVEGVHYFLHVNVAKLHVLKYR